MQNNSFGLEKTRLNTALADIYAYRAHTSRASAHISRSILIFIDSGVNITASEHYPDKIFLGFCHNNIFSRKSKSVKAILKEPEELPRQVFPKLVPIQEQRLSSGIFAKYR